MASALKRATLALAVALALPASAGEVTGHASSLSQLYLAKVDSATPELRHDEVAVKNQLFSGLDFDSVVLDVDWDLALTDARYSEDSAFDRDEIEYQLNHQLNLLNDRLTLSYLHERDQRQINTVRSSFKDTLFERGNGHAAYRDSVDFWYDSPEHHTLDMMIRASDHRDRLKDSGYEGTRELSARDYEWEFGRYRQTRGAHWKASVRRTEKTRTQGELFTHDEARFNLRAPLYNRLYLAGTGRYSDYHNSLDSSIFQGANVDKQRLAGVGLAWVRSPKHFLQVTRNWDVDNKVWSIGAVATWELADRWSLEGEHQRRFYGDQTQFAFSYTGLRNTVRLYHDEWVEQRYFARPLRQVEGVYVCTPSDDGAIVFDDGLCFMPDDITTPLSPEQRLLTRYETLFPIEEQLSLRKRYGLSWEHDYAKHAWQMVLGVNEHTDIDTGETERRDEGTLTGTYRLDPTSSIGYAARFSFREYDEGEKSRDRQYELGYYHALNRRADWFIKVVHTENTGTDVFGGFTDNRMVLGYRHHFGQRNPSTRGLFEAYRPNTQTEQR